MTHQALLLFGILCSFVMGFIYRFALSTFSIKVGINLANSVSTPEVPVTSPVDEELQHLLKIIAWPLPPAPASLQFSTHPKTCRYILLNPRNTYVVGEKVEVLVTAKDHKGQEKSYGGDLLQAKLHSPSLRAGVTGSVTDHYNGSYTASFILQWPGETMVSIRLIHSSEAIAILYQNRDTRPDKVFFNGHFEKNGTREVVECNFFLPGRNVCEYYDVHNKEKWVCEKPRSLPCDSYRKHSSGGNRNILSEEEQKFLSAALIDQQIPSTLRPLNVLSPTKITNAARTACASGLKNPTPSGFYYKDAWESLVCANQHFDNSNKVAQCLAGKMIYMFGDSTLRQWWEYIVKIVPSLKQIDLHVPHQTGPLLATDAEHNYLVHWRAHQKPLRMASTSIKELHYIASEVEALGARKGMVIVLTCGSHFLSYPIAVYVRRMHHIREAVARLLERSPETKVLIKSANTGYKFSHGSDWLSLQLDTVMRTMFSHLPVTILDVWSMTSCHREPENVHPSELIVKNEVDLMLSFICPQ